MNAACSACGSLLEPADVVYDEQGNVRCQGCLSMAQTETAKMQASSRVVSVAYSGPAIGLASFVFNPWGLLSIAAIGNGIYVLRSLRESDTAQRIGAKAEKAKVGAIAGIVIGAISGLLFVLSFFTKILH
jgi:hypothetical protein